MADSLTYSARWVVPVTRPPLENGTVTIRGDRIEAVDPQGVRSADRDLGNVAILPGLVNAHTHLDLSGARGLIPPTRPENFPDWLRSVIAYRRSRSADQVQQDIRRGLADCLAAGTVLLGDITAGGASWYVLKDAPIHSVIGWELIGLRESRYLEVTDEFQRRALPSWIDEDRPIEMPGNPRCRWWAAPHAPYSANHDQARGQLFLGNAVMHLAESPGEMALLTAKRGPFVRFLEELGLWNPAEIKSTADEFLLAWADSKLPRLYVHGNYLPGETKFGPRTSICYCPRTHAAFGHPPHPFREWLDRGVNICLGTDSLASNPDLDILAEAKFLKARYPEIPSRTLLEMITISGARALGWEDDFGSLEPGKRADLIAIPLGDEEGDVEEIILIESQSRSGRVKRLST